MLPADCMFQQKAENKLIHKDVVASWLRLSQNKVSLGKADVTVDVKCKLFWTKCNCKCQSRRKDTPTYHPKDSDVKQDMQSRD